MVYMARLGPGGIVQARDLARAESMPAKFLEAVLLRLKRFGYLESKVGSGGGYKLTRPSMQIRIGDLIRQLEEIDSSPAGVDRPVGEVALHLIGDRLQQALANLTLEEITEDAAKAGRQKDEMYYI
jgi:Rrf2 family protein